MTFDIDKNGIVNVRAKDLATNKEQAITIKSSSGLSEEEIQRMIKEAEENAERDRKKKEEAELRNEADHLIFTVDKTLKELKDKVDASEVEKANKAKDELKAALEKDNIDEIRAKRMRCKKSCKTFQSSFIRKQPRKPRVLKVHKALPTAIKPKTTMWSMRILKK